MTRSDDQKAKFRKRGWDRVAVHVFVVLIDRLLTALVTWAKNPSANVRSIT